MIINIAMIFIMRLLASFGTTAVAGFGIAIRIEELALAIFHAMGGAMSPFVGQNWGAKNWQRVSQGLAFCLRICLFGSLNLSLMSFLFSDRLFRF